MSRISTTMFLKNQDITIDKETVQLEASDAPYQLTPPASTEVSNKEDTTLPADAIYYPEKPLLEFYSRSTRATGRSRWSG